MTPEIPRGDRRERVRAATVQEIKATARRLLTEAGPESVTLRAIAREMGMTAPGLYRYFPSHEELWHALCHDTYDAIAVHLEQAIAAVPAEDAMERLVVASRAFREWAVQNKREFGLVFGMPLPGVQELMTPEDMAGKSFALIFTAAFLAVWQQQPLPVPADDDFPERLRAQLARYRDAIVPALPAAADLPIGVAYMFLTCWVRLYGVVTMEVFGHLGFCLDEVGDFFERMLADLRAELSGDRPG